MPISNHHKASRSKEVNIGTNVEYARSFHPNKIEKKINSNNKL